MTDRTNQVVEPYPDGRWWVVDHLPTPEFPLVCRGNTGEVFPNVVTPITGSIVNVPFLEGQAALSLEFGLATSDQLAFFDGVDGGVTGVFGGYLYSNVSLARTLVARTPGLSIDLIDRQMYGLSDAPPHRPVAGERSLVASARTARALGWGLLRLNRDRLACDQADIAQYVASVPEFGPISDEELLAIPDGVRPFLGRMMHNLMLASSLAGIGRSMLEGVVERLGDDGLVNRLTAGVGTIESAQPAIELWDLARRVCADADLTSLFDRVSDPAQLDGALRSSTDTASIRAFLDGFDAFRRRHGARGPDEWELASPTWGSDPAIGLALIDRLRHAPDDRDPHVAGHRLAAEREAAVARARRSLPRRSRIAFDVAVRGTTFYGDQREATKAAFVRALDPTRRALAELARRAGIPHADFFLLTIDQIPAALADASSVQEVIAERRARRDYLQARIPPFWFDGDVPDPSTWELRADSRRPDGGARVIEGMGVCSGTATGTARVVTDPTDPRDLGPTDILIAPITDPAWTPLFLAVAGVVVDVGAQQSHAAIVARELGIPAVVSASGASSTIPDGALVTVDGSAGHVTVH